MSRKKVAIIGFTGHRMLAPYENGEFEIWGLNDLYLDLPNIPNDRVRWFQVHPWANGRPVQSMMDFSGGPPHPRDANHVAWMREAAKRFPVYLMEPREEVPEAKVLVREDFYRYFSLDGQKPCNYFTNSISWMIGLAIMEGFTEIHVYGVDMMMGGGNGSEYGWQRPSCEWLIGWARGKGIKLVLPDESDLMKTAFPYGDKAGNAYRLKLAQHKKELQGRLNGVRQQMGQLRGAEAELGGAINMLEWQERSWMPGDGDPTLGRAPIPNAHKELATNRIAQFVETETDGKG